MITFFNKISNIFLKSLINILLILSILSLLSILIFTDISGLSISGILAVLQRHRVVTLFAIMMSGLISIFLPVSIVSFLIPEPVISKVSGTFGLSASAASALVLLVMIFFLSAIGVLVAIVLSIVFVTAVLLIRKSAGVASSFLMDISGILSLIVGISFIESGITMNTVLIIIVVFFILGVSLLKERFKKYTGEAIYGRNK